MKKFLFAAVFLLSTFCWSQITFQKKFDLPANFTANRVAVMPNGNIALAGNYSQTALFIAEFSPTGSLIQAFTLNFQDQTGGVFGFSISSAGQVDVVVAAGTWTSSYYHFVRVDMSGNVLISKQISSTGNLFVWPYSPPTIGYFPNGDIGIGMSEMTNMIMTRMDQQGNLVWSRVLTGDTLEPKNPSFTPCITSDGGALIPGKRNNDNLFIKLDGSGNIQWSKVFAANSWYCHPKKVIPAAGGGYYACGYMMEYATALGYGSLMKMDANGNLIWYKHIGGSSMDSAFVFTDMYQLSNGNLVLISSYGLGSNNLLLITDSNGQVLKKASFGSPSMAFSELGLAVTNTDDIILSINAADSSFMVTTSHLYRSNGSSMLWCDMNTPTIYEFSLFYNPAVSSAGFICNQFTIAANAGSVIVSPLTNLAVSDVCSNTGIGNRDEPVIKLYPNPAHTNINLELGVFFVPGVTYRISDMMGRVLMHGEITDSSFSLPVDQLSSGLYQFSLSSGQVTTFSRD